ncbi:hypothetical protein AQUCO_01000106v1 [Aquilegia coerulea]|uniref:Fe2OG dioxygenase domain-containing protein n=1 Tax=Aquilegia coerulea TaxID=218851 RepID=A0A2G5E8W9_AQUCA|nr:hypothetical protein AQUCO_01000106v1 [Aquilegia coerulea]
MAATASGNVETSFRPKIGCVKDLAESSDLTSIPSKYSYYSTALQIPTIDFSLLNSTSPDQRSKVIQDLGKACQEWGFFMLINHGVPESLMEGMLAMCRDFLDQTGGGEVGVCWKACPENYLKAISESLGLEGSCIDKAMELESCFQILTSNLYPPCPQPDLAMGMPPHSDHGLFIQNQNGGLQLNHNGKWVNVHALPNTFLVNTGDHLEILSNGKYKSVLHRAVVNNKATRISLAVTHGPCLDKVVAPVAELVDSENNPALYHGMMYKEYLEFQQSNQLNGKSHLDRIRI